MKDYIALNIKYLREEKNLNQEELADAIGKSKAAISEYERGKTYPKMEVLIDICRFFMVKMDDFVQLDLAKLKKSSKTVHGFHQYIPPATQSLQDKLDELTGELAGIQEKIKLLEEIVGELRGE